MKDSPFKKITRSIKNWFVDVLKKEKPVENKPADQVKEEKNPFYRPERIKCKHIRQNKPCTHRKNLKRKTKIRMQKFSRRMNRKVA
jgi:hypothetical protein